VQVWKQEDHGNWSLGTEGTVTVFSVCLIYTMMSLRHDHRGFFHSLPD